MKPTSFMLLSFFIFAIAASAAPDHVLDIAGKKLLKGVNYHILPVFRGRGGGGVTVDAKNKTCPLDVVQERYEGSDGLPLMFSPVNVKKGVIRVSTDLNIKFSDPSICAPQTMVWKLGKYDKTLGKWFVTTEGVEGNPGPATRTNWFKIEKYDHDYKLVFCPTICRYCNSICKDVGIYIDQSGIRRLTLNDIPLKVMFKKA